MSFDTLVQERTERIEKTICSFSPARIAPAAIVLLVLGTPRAQCGFQAPLSFDTGSGPSSVAVGDFNRDGIPDLAVANAGRAEPGSVSILLGNGAGTFRTAVQYRAGRTPLSVAVGDFNRDGILDL